MTSLLVTNRSLQDRRTSLRWWAVGLVVYSAFVLAVWPVIDGNQEFADLAESYPDGIKALMGGEDAFDALTTPGGFLNSYLFSMILPFIFVALAVSMGSALLAGEEENGLLDLLLSYPVTRTAAVLEKALAIVVALVAMGLVEVIVIVGVGRAFGLEVGFVNLAAATVGTVLFGVFHGFLALAAGAARGVKAFAMGLAWGVALVGYLLNVLSNLDPSLEWLRWGSPLYYATAGDPVVNGAPVEYVVIVGAGVAALVAAVALFRRHDVS